MSLITALHKLFGGGKAVKVAEEDVKHAIEEVAAAIEPKAVGLKNAIVDEVQNDLAIHAANLAGHLAAWEAAAKKDADDARKALDDRFAAIEVRLAALRADVAKKTAPARKTAAESATPAAPAKQQKPETD